MDGIPLYNRQGESVGTVQVPASFEGPVRSPLIWQAVRIHLGNQREGNANTKRRGEVRGGGRKPWKQKHTGRARAGTIRSPLWRKGGIVFGPHTREYRQRMPVRMRRLALADSLRSKCAAREIAVVETLEGMGLKTKALAAFLKRIQAGGGALLVVDRSAPDLARIARNIPKVEVRPASDLTCYDVLATPKLVLTSEALKQLEGCAQ